MRASSQPQSSSSPRLLRGPRRASGPEELGRAAWCAPFLRPPMPYSAVHTSSVEAGRHALTMPRASVDGGGWRGAGGQEAWKLAVSRIVSCDSTRNIEHRAWGASRNVTSTSGECSVVWYTVSAKPARNDFFKCMSFSLLTSFSLLSLEYHVLVC